MINSETWIMLTQSKHILQVNEIIGSLLTNLEFLNLDVIDDNLVFDQ